MKYFLAIICGIILFLLCNGMLALILQFLWNLIAGYFGFKLLNYFIAFIIVTLIQLLR